MKIALLSFIKRIFAFFSSLLLLICPGKSSDSPETANAANTVSEYDASQSSYVLNIDAENAKHEISDLLFGAFFEDINFAADGGLYAEMVSNRSFEFTSLAKGDGLFGYEAVNGAVLSLKADEADGLNENNPTFLTVANEITSPAGFSNRGFLEGMALKKNEGYNFSVYARSKSYKGNIFVQLCEGENVLCSEVIPNITSSWEKYSLSLISPADATENVTVRVLIGKGEADFDMVSLFPAETFKGRENGLRKDLGEALEKLRPKFLRFPGGCVIEGESEETAYSWKDSVGASATGEPLLWNGKYGDVAARRQGISLWTDLGATDDPYPSFMSYGLGFYEFFLLCEDIGAKPVPVLNAGLYCQMRGKGAVDMDSSKYAAFKQDMLDLIEFANGSVSTKWGAVRASMGHPESFNLKLIAVGNENEGEVYWQRYADFLDELKSAKEKDPSLYGGVELIFSSGASDGISGGMYLPSYQFAKDYIGESGSADDFAAATDHHYYQSPEWLLKNADYYDENNYRRSVNEMTDTAYGGGLPVFLGEYAGRSNTVRAALAEAAYMTGLERNGDIVKMASYAPLFSSLTARHWSPNLIWFNNREVKTSINYEVQRLFSSNTGSVLLESSLDGAAIPSEELSGRVGVGTWNTAAEFDNLLVTDNESGKVIYKDNFNVPNFLWKWENVNKGNFKIKKGVLVHEGTDMKYSDLGDSAFYESNADIKNYSYEIDARKTAGEEGFFIPFAVKDKSNCFFWNIGGWGNTVSCLQRVENGQKSGQILKTAKPFTVEEGKTYHLKITISGTEIKCWIDDELMVDYDAANPAEAEAYQVVSRDDSGRIIIKLVNVTEKKKVFAVNLDGININEYEPEFESLAGESPDAESGQVTSGRLNLPGNHFNFTSAAESVTIITLTPKQ